MYNQLIKMSGEKCFTLTSDKPADMYVDEVKVTIIYSTGNTLDIPRGMVVEAINMLKRQGMLTVDDVHEKLTNRRRARTDRLMAVLRKLPGVTFDKRPRILFFKANEGL